MSHPFSRNSIIALFLILLPLFLYQSALSAEIRLAWDPNSETDLIGYKVYYGTSGRTGTDPNSCGLCGYSTSVNVGNVTYTITGLTLGQTYFISATAYNAFGESSYSNEVWGTANDPPIPLFSDVPIGYWAYDYINAIYNAHITTGYGDGRYGPEDLVTREQMAAFIVRADEGDPPLNYCDSNTLFPDVTPEMWSCRYIKRLYELGITTGYQDGTYGPYDYVLREQMAAFIVRAIEGEPPLNYCDSGSLFTDVTPDMWSCNYIKRLKELGITTGYQNGTYGPYDLVTRDQMAAFLARAFLEME